MKVNISEFINNQKLSFFQNLVIVLCGLLAAIDGYDTQSIAFAVPVIAPIWGVDSSAFGVVFAAGLFGLMVGSMLFGPIADRFGRKNTVLISLLIVGVFSLITVRADSMNDLLLFRFLTGIGLGGILPNILSITAEYSPRRIQNTMVTVMFCGFPLGAVLGGFVMSRLIPVYGWEIVFYAGGALPLILIPIVWIWMPESIRFLTMRGTDPDKVKHILLKINPDHVFQKDDQFELFEKRPTGALVKNLFANGLAKSTLLIWIIYFMIFLILYSLINWLPSILNSAGFPLEKAIISTVLFNLGGIVGGIAIGRLIDGKDQRKILASTFGLGAVIIAIIGFMGHSIPILLAMVFVAGLFMEGSLLGVQAFTTSVYNTSLRSTGLGWATGIGRIGSILGPLLAGWMLDLAFNLSTIFIAIAIPAVIASAVMIFLNDHQIDA